jgi:hypothetical protein
MELELFVKIVDGDGDVQYIWMTDAELNQLRVLTGLGQ